MDNGEIKLLIVCENDFHLNTVHGLFENPAHTIAHISSIPEALERIHGEYFDMILIDAAIEDPERVETAYTRLITESENAPVIIFFAFGEVTGSYPSTGSPENGPPGAGTSRVFQLIQKKVAECSAAKRNQAELLSALRDKELLLAEMQHRIKNNLQTISSMLNIQASYTKDPKSVSLIQDIQSRISSVALIYDVLYESNENGMIDFSSYLRGLVSYLTQVFNVQNERIHIQYQIESIQLHRDMAMHCGLILNELFTNAIKHAFKDGRNGVVTVSLSRMPDGRIELGVSDNGVGFPEDFDYKNNESMGILLINTLTRQVKGTMCFDGKDGSKFTLVFRSETEK